MQRGKGFTIIELAIVAGIFFIMIAALTPFVRIVKARSNRIKCAANLMRVSLALHMYASEHNDAFPEKLGDLYPNYLADEKDFDCPASKKRGSQDDPDYYYAAGLTEISPGKEIIVRDFDDNHRKSGKNMLRVNGAVEWVPRRH